MITLAILLFSVVGALAQGERGASVDTAAVRAQRFECPLDVDGYFPDPYQCDKYFYCRRGELEEKLCPDGLFFDHTQARNIEACDYPFHIDCDGEYQPSTGRGVCIFANGFFEHEDPQNCRDYYECTHNEPRMLTCPQGLFFEPDQGTCQWEHSSLRVGCVDKPKTLESTGFTCPQNDTQTLENGHELQHTRYIVEDDCRSFIVCEEKRIPRLAGCSEGKVFSDLSLLCEAPETVPGCENYYLDSVPADDAAAALRRRRK